jgi:hypothetical protein
MSDSAIAPPNDFALKSTRIDSISAWRENLFDLGQVAGMGGQVKCHLQQGIREPSQVHLFISIK